MIHETSPSSERTKKVHWLQLSDDIQTYVPGISVLQRFEVNSLHHQVVDKAPENAVVIAKYDSNNTFKEIEALGYTNYPAVTVQWHPEEIWDEFSMRAIRNLLKLEQNDSKN